MFYLLLFCLCFELLQLFFEFSLEMNSKNNLNLTKVVPEGSIQTSKESVYEFDNDPRMHTLDDSTIDIK